MTDPVDSSRSSRWRQFCLLLVIAADGLLAACSTTPIATSAAQPVPESRVVDAQLLRPSPGTGLVVVKRDAGALASMCATDLYVDGRLVAYLRQGEKLSLYLTLGDHMLAAQYSCGGILQEQHVTVTSNRSSQNFRVGYGLEGVATFGPTAF